MRIRKFKRGPPSFPPDEIETPPGLRSPCVYRIEAGIVKGKVERLEHLRQGLPEGVVVRLPGSRNVFDYTNIWPKCAGSSDADLNINPSPLSVSDTLLFTQCGETLAREPSHIEIKVDLLGLSTHPL